MPKTKRNVGSTDSSTNCIICLGAPRFPTGRPDGCEHVFCFHCIRDWVKRRSECPLCKRPAKFIIRVGADGSEERMKVKKRTAAHYENDFVTQEELGLETREEVDITVAYARCRVCHESTNEEQLMLCDGVVGHEADGTEIRCNAAYHCYCLPERLSEVPEGDWFCPFCVDLLATQRGVYNRRYSSRVRIRRPPVVEPESDVVITSDEDYDQPGPSRVRRPRRIESESEESSDAEEVSENEEILETEISEASESEESAEEESDSGETNEREGDQEMWDAIDDYVLEEVEDNEYDPAGRTAVRRTRKKKKKKAKRGKKKVARRMKKKSVGRTTKPVSKKEGGVRKKRKSTRRKRRRQAVTDGQRRLALAIGIDPVTGAQEKKAAKVKTRRFPADGVHRGKFGAPLLLLNRGDYDEIPVDEPKADTTTEVTSSSDVKEVTGGGDLLGSILVDQTILLSRAEFKNMKICRDGTICHNSDAERLSEMSDKVASISEKSMSVAASAICEKPQVRITSRKNRPSRWGSPPTSNNQTSVITASIPLPAGPPLSVHSHLLDSIPIPQRSSIRPAMSPQVALAPRPSALNTSPSTSFAVNAFASPLPPPFAAMSSQPPAGLPQIGTAHIPQQPLLQIPSQLFPNLVMQPPISLGAVNNMLAAGLLTTTPFAPPISQGAPFVLNQVQFPAQNHQFSQQLANLASLQSAVSAATVHPRLPLAGVPPPPPTTTRCPDVGVSVCEPLAEKIRQLAETNMVNPFFEAKQAQEKSAGEIKKASEEPRVNDSGRKSASAEDEEASDPGTKGHKNGKMFELARQMLSESLKKVFKKKLITKEEYKEIMKKGVAALSQRSKLDQKKVDEYANKYVECVVHRRKKRH